MKRTYYQKNFDEIIPYIVYQRINQADILTISKENLVFTLHILKKHVSFQYKMLLCLSGVDLLSKQYRFCLAYELLSLTHNTRLRLKFFVEEYAVISSITSVFLNSNWWEREV